MEDSSQYIYIYAQAENTARNLFGILLSRFANLDGYPLPRTLLAHTRQLRRWHRGVN